MNDGGSRHETEAHGRGSASIDQTSPAFGRRLANVLAERRRERGKSLRSLARRSHHAFTARDLRAFEAGQAVLSAERIDAVVELYDANIEDILAERVGLSIRPYGVLATSGLTAPFIPDDSTSLLLSYLKLVRQLRTQQHAPTIELRREDVEALAEFIGEDGTSVIERLGALMGATMTQRRAMAGMFVAGAMVIGLAGGSVAAIGSDGGTGTETIGASASTTLVVLDEHGTALPDVTAPTTQEAPSTTASTAPAPSTTVATVTTAPSSTPSTTTEPTPVTAPATTPSTTPATGSSNSGSHTSGTGSAGSGTTSSTTPAITPAATDDTPAADATPTADDTPAADSGGSIFDDDVPTEASPIPPSVDDTASDPSADPSADPAAPDDTTPADDVAVDEPPVEGEAGDPTYTDPGAGDAGATDETGEQATDLPPLPFEAVARPSTGP